jgi:hypothetical protein
MTKTVHNPTGGRMFLINLFGKGLSLMITQAAVENVKI